MTGTHERGQRVKRREEMALELEADRHRAGPARMKRPRVGIVQMQDADAIASLDERAVGQVQASVTPADLNAQDGRDAGVRTVQTVEEPVQSVRDRDHPSAMD